MIESVSSIARGRALVLLVLLAATELHGRIVAGCASGPLRRVADPVWMKVNASAMTGASITSARIFAQYAEGIEDRYEVPVNEEFFYLKSDVYIGGFLTPYTIDAPAPPYGGHRFPWFRP